MKRKRGHTYLVEVGLQEVKLNLLLCQARPVLLTQFLLAQHQLDLAVGVVDFAVLGVNLGEEVQRDGVCDTLARGTSEGDVCGGEVELGVVLGDIGSLEAHVEVVALSIIG